MYIIPVIFISEGELVFKDRHSRPHKSLSPMHLKKVKVIIITMRKERILTGIPIARKLKMPQRKVSRHLILAKLSQQKDIENRDEDPPRPYEHEALGEMIYLEIKKLRNSNYEGVRDCRTSNLHKSMYKEVGSQCMHIALDDPLR